MPTIERARASTNRDTSAPAPYAIRRLGPDDAAAYRALRLQGLRDHPDAFTSSYEEESVRPIAVAASRIGADSPDRVYGAFRGDTLCAVVGLGLETRAKARHKAVVFGMYVAPADAGHGLGSALLAHAIDAARREPGITQLVLTVTDTNAAAVRFYERAGFRSFGIEPRAIRVGDEYFAKNHMILPLDSSP
jgi:ribosomal protein S18 acetylase RimI-like enzyme